MTQRKVVIERRQDPSLIAGVVTRIGGNTIDGSVRGRLMEIERTMRNT
jgi:F-type H+-transporting ATPase subunit delta